MNHTLKDDKAAHWLVTVTTKTLIELKHNKKFIVNVFIVDKKIRPAKQLNK